ncbi:phosphoribosyltransferase-like protein [Pseudovibrio sp. Ad5]|uniref:phosphoribosyltransferase-like protein n=1 Tax=Pseudovibrio sp. Ad5 TaxID=989436 RepID=UPI0007AEC9F9|nr:hypothetical protein [Pseudovibrio sp. Ad5]
MTHFNVENYHAIPRSKKIQPRGDFSQMIAALEKQPWLHKKQTEMDALIEELDDAEQKTLIFELLGNFTYICSHRLSDFLGGLAETISTQWGCTPHNTIIVALNRGQCADSSQAILWHLKPAMAKRGAWTPNLFVIDIEEAAKQCNQHTHIANVIIIDEFSGTGKTIDKELNRFKNQLNNASGLSIRIALVALMQDAFEKFPDFIDDFYFLEDMRPGISSHIEESKRPEAIEIMKTLEGKLAQVARDKKLKKHIFGWGKSEALYYYENGNTPNNVFPIFWWPEDVNGQQRLTLLNRV